MFTVFPATLKQDGNRVQKVPLENGWQQSATTDQQQIALWQNTHRDNIRFWGVPTGTKNNILVLDVDAKPGKPNGFNSLQKEGLIIPPTMCQATPSGGCHYIYNYPNDGKTYGNIS